MGDYRSSRSFLSPNSIQKCFSHSRMVHFCFTHDLGVWHVGDFYEPQGLEGHPEWELRVERFLIVCFHKTRFIWTLSKCVKLLFGPVPILHELRNVPESLLWER